MVLPPVFYPRNEVLTTRTNFNRNRTTFVQNNNLTNFTLIHFIIGNGYYLHKIKIGIMKNNGGFI